MDGRAETSQFRAHTPAARPAFRSTKGNLPRAHLIKDSLEIARKRGAFTIFSLVDAPTQVSQNENRSSDWTTPPDTKHASVPEGVSVIVWDYDVEGVEPDLLQQDENGDRYIEAIWTPERTTDDDV